MQHANAKTIGNVIRSHEESVMKFEAVGNEYCYTDKYGLHFSVN